MTADEAIKQFEERLQIPDYKTKIPEYYEAMELAIKVFEEIQQYRELGTVEEIADYIKQSEEEFNMLMEYRNIGTIEEFKALKEKVEPKKVALRLCGDCQRGCIDCDRYEDRCPTCNGGLYVESGENHEYCPNCGQKLDWSE